MADITALDKYPCAACGAQAQWNPAKQLLVCPFCGSSAPFSVDAATQKIEELVHQLRGHVTVIIVTHNMQQAARVSDRTAFMLLGELVENAPTSEMFTTPHDSRTEAYITGRFG